MDELIRRRGGSHRKTLAGSCLVTKEKSLEGNDGFGIVAGAGGEKMFHVEHGFSFSTGDGCVISFVSYGSL